MQKCYDEISILKEELKKRDEQIEKLIENNINLNKKVESLLSKTPFYQKGGPSRSKVAKLVENYEKNIAKPIPKPRTIKTTPIPKPRTIKTTPIPKPIPAPRAKVAKLVENYEKNIAKPIPKPRTIKTTPIPAPRTKVTPIVKEIPIPSDNMFIDEEKPEIIKSAFKKNQKRYKLNVKYIHSPMDEMKSKINVIENILKDNLKTMK